jgi:hypothetical protein
VMFEETGMMADTVAKLLYEHSRPNGADPIWNLAPGTTVIIDEAGMLSTADLYRLTELARKAIRSSTTIGSSSETSKSHATTFAR